MDIKNLTTFIHVAELNSFTKAGEVLGFSQSTISFQIKQLETELDSQLFERIGHTVALTEKGREVLDYAHLVSKLTQELKQNIQDEKAVSGHIRLAMAASLCTSMLLEGFERFRERYPGITLKLIAAGTEEMFRLLDHNGVDAILTLDSHIYNTEYVTARKEKVGVHFVAGGECASRHKGPISVRELSREPFILTEKGMSYRKLMDERLAEMSLEIHPVLEVGSADLLISLVEQGIGISFLPDHVTAPAVKAGRAFYLDVEDLKVEVWKQLLYHRDKWVSPQLESVLRYCIEKEFTA